MSPALAAESRPRIHSIDVLRGIIMVIMALDHTRDFFHKTFFEGGTSVATNPTDLETTTPALFFTRWITHFCAPLFVFLAGTSAWLMRGTRSTPELSGFLIRRGIWLVLVEIVIITFGWTFNPLFNVIILQVIWAIGVSMIFLGLLIWLPFRLLLLIGLLIVFGHNILDISSVRESIHGGFLADLLYFSNFSVYNLGPQHFVFIVYSFVPWLGVMILGYCFGKIFSIPVPGARRRQWILFIGIGMTLLFLLLRFINRYGDPVPWSVQPRESVFTFLSFINVNKYPPSLGFLLVTIGPGLIALSLLDAVKSRITEFFRVYGRVPLFYYILHFYIIHMLVVIVFFVQGYSTDQIVTPNNPFLFRPPDFGFGLLGVYLVWIFVVAVLYPLCRMYDRYKTKHIRDKPWLSYL